MKGMQKISRGKGFGGVLRYAAQGEKKELGHGRFLGGTMAGRDEKELGIEFRIGASHRPDVSKPVWHSSLRMPKNEDVSDQKWIEIGFRYMEKMGWELEKSQFCIWKHDDDEHIHIIANRVLSDGKLFYGQNENLQSTRVIGELEHEFGLTVTKGVNVDERGRVVMPERSSPKKAELEKALRLEEKPPRMVLQAALDAAMVGRPTVTAFVEALEASGVEVYPNVASTGRVSGLAFGYGGLRFSGSELGARYKWGSLIKEVSYDEARDGPELVRRRKAGAGRADHAAASGTDPALANEDLGTSGSDRAVSPDPRPARAPAGRDQGKPEANRRVPSEAAAAAAAAAAVVGEIARPAVAADVKAKRAAWRRQHQALGAARYRITLADRVQADGKDRTHNQGKKDGVEELFTPDQVEEMIPALRAKNSRGFDVYLTPMDKRWHYIVVDDMTPQTLKAMRSAGYQPALVQESSKDNLQAIVKAARVESPDEQSIANQLVRELNQQFGDPKFTGVIHPFRMAGFSNKKAGKRNAFTRVLEAVGAVCSAAMRFLSSKREKIAQEAAMAAAEGRRQDKIARIQDPKRHALAGPTRAYQVHAKRIGTRDGSAMDFGVACEMLKAGFDRDEVRQAIQDGSPEIEVRHRNVDDYLDRTLDAAQARIGIVATGPVKKRTVAPKE